MRPRDNIKPIRPQNWPAGALAACLIEQQHKFPGLKPGDQWCLCADRWYEAYQAGVAPAVVLAATHRKTLETVPLEALRAQAVLVH